METATSLVIGQLSGYLRGLTQRLDPGAGWYGEFLRRDPEGLRACLDGAAMPPWDVVESLLSDLAGARGAEFAARETQYAARLRAAAVATWDRLPDGAQELRTLLAAVADQRAASEAAVRGLTARLAATTDRTEADTLSRELAWTRDDAARAAARQVDLASRLTALQPPAPEHTPARQDTASAEPAGRPASPWSDRPGPTPPDPGWSAGPWPAGTDPSAGAAGAAQSVDLSGGGWRGDPAADGTSYPDPHRAGPERHGGSWPSDAAQGPGAWAGVEDGGPLPGVPRQREAGEGGAQTPTGRVGWSAAQAPAEAPVGWSAAQGSAEVPVGWSAAQAPVGGSAEQVPAEAPVGRAEGRWLRGVRRAGGARYAGAAAPEAPASFTPPPGHPDGPAAAPRGARFGRPDPDREDELPAPRGARFAPPPARTTTLGRARFAPPVPEVQSPGAGRLTPTGPEVQSGAGDRFAPPGPEVQSGTGHRFAPPGPEAQAGAAGRFAPSGPGGQAGGGMAGVIAELAALRAQGRSGEAHALLCEAAAWPAERLPAFAAELARAGLGADWATLLWEAASLPPERLAAAAAALGEAGRHADCEALLRQGAARPAAEIADAALALAAAGRTHEADALLGAFVKVRTAEEAVRLARRDPQWFTPRLLRAAEALSAAHHRDLVHALRVAKPSVS